MRSVVAVVGLLAGHCGALDWNVQQAIMCADAEQHHQMTCAGIKPECVTRMPAHAFATATTQCIQRMQPRVFQFMTEAHLAALPKEAFAAMSKQQCHAMQEHATGALKPSQCAGIPAHCFLSMNPEAMQALQPECITEMPAQAFLHLTFDQSKAISKGGIDGMLIEQMHAMTANPMLCGAWDSVWPRMIDPVACGELTPACWNHLDTGLQVIPENCILHMSPATFRRAMMGNDGQTEVSFFCRNRRMHPKLPVALRRVIPSSVCGECALSNVLFPQCPVPNPAKVRQWEALMPRLPHKAPAAHKPGATGTIVSQMNNGFEAVEIRIQKVNGRLGLATAGTKITAVAPDGAAEHAGIQTGMSILMVNGKHINNADELTTALAAAPQAFAMTVLRPKVTALSARTLAHQPSIPRQPHVAGASKLQRLHQAQGKLSVAGTFSLAIPALSIAAATILGFIWATRNAPEPDYSSV